MNRKSEAAAAAASSAGKELAYCTLADMKPGEKASVAGYSEAAGSYRRKLLSMGVTRGAVLTYIQAAPLGDPVEISIRGYSLSLRKAEAGVLLLQKIS